MSSNLDGIASYSKMYHSKKMNKDETASPLFSTFRFSPSITSTSGRPVGNESRIVEKRPLRKKESFSSKLFSHQNRISNEYRITKPRHNFQDVFKALRISCTPRESFRLGDKEKYKQLLQQYTSAELLSSQSSCRKQLSILPPPELIDLSQENETSGAVRKIKHDRFSSSRIRREFESSGHSALPSLSLPAMRFPSKLSSVSKDKITPFIDLASNDTSSSFGSKESDDIIITKEIIPKKKIMKNSLENKLRISPFYSGEWLGNIKQFYRDKVKSLDSDVRSNLSERSRQIALREKCDLALWSKVSKRIADLDVRFPEKVIELSEEEELPELTPEMEIIIEKAFKGGPLNEVLADKFSLQVTRRDIHTLAGLNWLNDEVINFYMNLLMERSQNSNYPSLYAFNTFFYPKLSKMGYNSVRRWTKKVDIFSHNLLVIPIHLGMHWCVSVIDFRSNSIRYYDSMLGNNTKCLSDLSAYLNDEHRDKKKSTLDMSKFSKELVKDIPQQMNGSDCGMFSCKFAEYISRDTEISFSQEHMPYFRRLMVYEIVSQRLL